MRLDHLLSKEHAPLWVTVRVAPIVVVFTSGIIDIPLPVPVFRVRSRCCRVRVLVCGGRPVCRLLVRRWVGAHCWGSEESDGVSCLGLRAGFGPWARPAVCSPVGGCGVGVGLLFEIWIVDASIFVVCCVHCHV